MCIAESECAGGACVAGRCLASGATPAIANARRLLFDPIDVAYVRAGDGSSDAPPAVATFGGTRDRGATAFVRFAAAVPPEATVLEAYVVLSRARDVDGDAAPIVLRATRVVEAWDARSLSWAHQPRVVDDGTPATRVVPAAGDIVRLDVREIVERWRRRGKGDSGVAIVAEGDSGQRGVPFAMAPGPRLEIYVR